MSATLSQSMYFISLFCYLYAILIFFSLSIYSSNVGICLITSFQAWFLIMAPSHYSLLSGFLLNFVLFLHSSSVFICKFFLNGLPFCLQFCKQLESMWTGHWAPLSRLSSIFSSSPFCPSTPNFCPR